MLQEYLIMIKIQDKDKYTIICEFEAFTVVMFQVEVFWVVTQCSKDGGTIVLWNIGILSNHYTASYPRTLWHGSSLYENLKSCRNKAFLL